MSIRRGEHAQNKTGATTMKKLFAALLAVLMVFTVMPAAFSAAATETPTENGQQPTDNAGVTLFGFADWKLTNGVAEPSKPYNFIGFNSENPSVVQSKLNMGSRVSFAAEIIGSTIYAFAHTYTDDADVPTADDLYTIDTTASTWSAVKVGGNHMDYSVVDLTYAGDTDTLYAMVQEDLTGDQLIMTVNRSNGALTEVANLSELEVACINKFAYIGGGQFYTTAHNGGHGLILNTSGRIVRELEESVFAAVEQIIAVTYYPQGNCLFGVAFRSIPAGNYSILYKINPQTGVSEEIGAVGGGFGYSLTSIFPVPNVQITLPEVPDEAAMNAALNAPGSNLTFVNDGNTPWCIQSDNGRTYMQSTTQNAHSSSTTVKAVFNGLTAGQVLSFDWMVSSENNYDWLSFYSNDTRVDRISGSVNWTTKTYTVPANGNYTFRWVYSKDSSASNGSDCGSIDNISITGTQPAPYDPGEQANELDEAANAAGSNLHFMDDPLNPWAIDRSEAGRVSLKTTIGRAERHQVLYTVIYGAKAGDAVCFDWKIVTQGLPIGGEYGSISIDKIVFRMDQAIVKQISGTTDWESCAYVIPEDGDYYFSWDFIAYDDSEVLNAVTSWVDNIAYVEDYVPPVAPGDPAQFNAAVNAAGESRSFVNDSVHPWVVVTDSGRSCVRSDIAGMNSTDTEFTVDVGYLEAGSVISFDWKTSSESGWDRLCLTLNGLTQKAASGQNDWSTVRYEVPVSDYYTVGWKYEKNYYNAEYSDCVFVDNVKIEPVNVGNMYTVTFVDGVDGSIISEVSVPEGGSAALPNPPAHEGYTFSHWEGTYQNVTANSTVTAVYTANGIMGDVDGDGRVTIADAVAIMRHALDLTHIPAQYMPYADVNGDGAVNLSDAVTVMRMAIGVM